MRKRPLAHTPVPAAPGCVGKGKHTFKGSADALVNFTKKGRDIRPTWNRIPRCIRLSHRPTSYTYIKLRTPIYGVYISAYKIMYQVK